MFRQAGWEVLIATAVLSFTVTFGDPVVAIDPADVDSSRYIAVGMPMTRADAADYCMLTYGTYLATCNDDRDVVDMRVSVVAAGIDEHEESLWVGLDVDDDGNLAWDDGSLVPANIPIGPVGPGPFDFPCGIALSPADEFLLEGPICIDFPLFCFVCNAPDEPTLAPSAAPTITHKRSECPVPNLEPCESFRCLGTDSLGNDENPNCIKKRPWGCKECADGFFRETLRHHPCIECSTIEGCLDCNDWTACSQCDEANGYTKRWSRNCGFFICKSS